VEHEHENRQLSLLPTAFIPWRAPAAIASRFPAGASIACIVCYSPPRLPWWGRSLSNVWT